VIDEYRHGLRGMYERAEQIGGNLAFRRHEHVGTLVELTLEKT
jgi:signal transduction histidine kinase